MKKNKVNQKHKIQNIALTSGALFSGIGGFCFGFGAKNIKTVWANDLDPYACSIYKHNHKDVRLLEKDVKELSVKRDKLKPVDILHAGFPCQSFSQAGVRNGFDDERGKLFFEIIRIIDEFKKNKPKVLILENAPYLRYGEGGMWFLEIMRAIQKAGYWFRESNARELDLYELTHIPQQRIRLFMVAFSREYFRSGKFPFPQLIKPKRKDITKFIDFNGEQSGEYYLDTENRYYNMIKKENIDTASKKYIYQLRKYIVRQKKLGICPTLTANMGGGGHNVPFIWDKKGLRKLTEIECLKLQGFPSKFKFPENISMGRKYEKIGNAVSPAIAQLLADSINIKFKEMG